MDLERFNQIMCEKNLSDSELAKRIGVTRQSISTYRSGKAKPPFEKVKEIAEALNVSAFWLLGYDSTNKELASYYDTLNEEGQRKVMEYARDMAKIYKK